MTSRSDLRGVAAACRPWTGDELAILRARRRFDTAAHLGRRIGRTGEAVKQRAHALGLRKARRWDEQDKALRFLWAGEDGLASIARELRRTPAAVIARAEHLGLPFGPPPGCEYLKASAQRLGVDVPELRRALALAGVPVHESRSRRPGEARVKPRGFYVNAEDATEAMNQWMAMEWLGQAARVRGIPRPTLLRWLLAAGLRPPERRRRWRVPSASIDLVIAARRPPVPQLRKAA